MTYTTLALIAVGLAAITHVACRAVARRRGTLPPRLGTATAVTAVVLVALTVVFDSLMIAADLFRFDAGTLLGVTVWLAPVEDLAWPVAMALVLPALAAALAASPGGEAAPALAATSWRRVLTRLVGTSRPISWVNTAYPFVAAYALAGGESWLLGAIAGLYFLVPYNLAMYGINDVFDHESDLANPRKGGVEGIILERRLHRTTIVAAAATNVPFLVVLAAVGTPAANSGLAIAVLAVVGYSAPPARLKERPVIDSLTSATHFVAPAVYGVALAGGAFSTEVLAVLAAFFVWGAASHAFGAVQDVRADRAAGIGSVATVLGARVTTRLALGGYVLSGVLVLVGAGWPGRLAAAAPLLHAINVWPHRHVTDETCESAHAGWRRFLWLNQVCGALVTLVIIAIFWGW
ncbi:prenyltransferase [Sanguibacter sp. A247]|uniref:prenyltransferase n=1 Tax=unclassified Sanguibacter TaxID=2645534 RepID=UPI003FD8CC47